MEDLVLYQENQIEIDNKIKYYKKLGINAIIIDPFKEINEENIKKAIITNNLLKSQDIRMIVKIDLKDTVALLLNSHELINWDNPKIRKSFYQFINYLKNNGIAGFYIHNFDQVLGENYIYYLKELSKNALSGENIVSIGEINSNQISYQSFLTGNNSPIFTYIYNNDLNSTSYNFLQAKEYISSIQAKEIKLLYSTNNLFKNFTNMENFPFLTSSLLAGTNFLLGGSTLLKDLEELGIFENPSRRNAYRMIEQSKKTFDFYQKLIAIKTTKLAILRGSYRQILNKDKDIFAFVRSYKDEKIIVFANFSQKEILADIRFHFLDINYFTYLIGNYGRRKIVKNLLLRPYEFVAFIK